MLHNLLFNHPHLVLCAVWITGAIAGYWFHGEIQSAKDELAAMDRMTKSLREDFDKAMRGKQRASNSQPGTAASVQRPTPHP